MKRRGIFLLVFSAVLIVAFGVCTTVSADKWFINAQEKYFDTYWIQRERIKEKESLETFLTFDEPDEPEYSRAERAEEYFRDMATAYSGVAKARGKHGYGLRFNGEDDSFFTMRHAWVNIPDMFSIAFWMKLEKLPVSQDIFCAWDPTLKNFGISLDMGKLSFAWPSRDSSGNICTDTLSYDFHKYGEFVHIAVIADKTNSKKIRLYENGICMAESEFSEFNSFRWQFMLGRGNFNRKRFPFHGTIDDLAVWNRAISENELHSIFKSPNGLKEYFSTRKENFTLWRRRVKAKAMEKLGSFFSLELPNSERSLKTQQIKYPRDSLSIYIREPNVRRLARAHARSRRSGCTLAPAAPVEAFASIGKQTTECRITLAGGTTVYPFTDRPAYIIEPAGNRKTFPNGTRRIELIPPEKGGWLVPLAVSEIRKRVDFGKTEHSDCDLIKLEINGLDRGIYLLRDASLMHSCQTDLSHIWKYKGPGQPFFQRKEELEYYSPEIIDKFTAELVAFLSDEDKSFITQKLSTAQMLLDLDVHSPVPHAIRRREIRENAGLCAEIFSFNFGGNVEKVPVLPQMFLGENLNDWCVTDDLDFSKFRNKLPADISVLFESSRTNIISDSGIVTRPLLRPELVTINAKLTNKNKGFRIVPLEFRVLPVTNALPALCLWTAAPIGRTHRTDALIDIFEFNDGSANSIYTDSASIRYRGNSSFIWPKKLISIKTENSHHWFGNTDTRHILTVDATTDRLRVWNSLAYDLFRSFPRSDGITNIAPHVKVAELFVNGKYWSLIEFAERVDEHLLGSSNRLIFRHQAAQPRNPVMRQTFPDISKYNAIETYLDFENLLSETNFTSDSLSQIKSRLDMTSIADLMILFSLFGNVNGINHSFAMQEDLIFDTTKGRFFYVPWDFELLSFRHTGIIENELNIILAKNDPEYNGLVYARWQELRRTVLTAENISAQLKWTVSKHVEYLPFEFNTWYKKKNRFNNIDLEIQNRCLALEMRLEQLDELFKEKFAEQQ